MIYYRRIFCWLRGIWRTIETGVWLEGHTVQGHDFRETGPDQGQPSCVTILECTFCDSISVTWSECARCGHA